MLCRMCFACVLCLCIVFFIVHLNLFRIHKIRRQCHQRQQLRPLKCLPWWQQRKCWMCYCKGLKKRQIQLLWTISRSQRLRRSQIQKRNSWRIRRNRRKWQKQRQNQEARIARLPRGSLGQRMERSHPMLCMFLGKVSPRMYRRNLNKDAADAAFVHFAPDHVGSREVGGCETPSHRIWFDCLVSVETTWLIHLFTNSSMS